MKWWKNPDTVFAVAELAIYTGDLLTAVDVLRFWEKPQNYGGLYDLYDNDQSVQGELQDERRATL